VTVPIEITHHEALALAVGKGGSTEGALTNPDARWEHIHQATVKGLLLRTVIVVLIASGGLRTVEAKRVDRIGTISGVVGIGIVGEQRAGEPVYRGSPGAGMGEID
jgi:hypothetical protein